MTVAQRRSATPRQGTRTSKGLHRPSLRLEKSLLRDGCLRLAGMDEVGRGALAGPVTVGVVVVTQKIGRVPDGLRDSKLLTPAAREALVGPVRRWAREYAVGHASAVEIDSIGIMAAMRAAARRALAQLPEPVDALLLDGKHNYLLPPDPSLFDDLGADQPDEFTGDDDSAPTVGHGDRDGVRPVVPIAELPVFGDQPVPPVHLKVKADLTCAAVAGASVLAKTERDRLLAALDPYFPEYGFAVNKGYATPEHRAAIRRSGPSVVHRRSWHLVGHDELEFPHGLNEDPESEEEDGVES